MREQVEVYLAGSGKGREALTTCAEILDAWCISKPTEGDIEKLKAELLGRGKKPQTVANWLTMFRKFLDWNCPNWRQPQEGEIEQMSLGFEDEQEREGLQNEPETLAVIENTTGNFGDEPVNVEANAPITEGQYEPVDVEVQDEPDTLSLPVEAVQEGQPRRGRKPKDAQERRSVKLSIYLTPKLYEGLKFLASAKGEDISDVVFTQLEDFVSRNSENVENIRNFFASLGTIK